MAWFFVFFFISGFCSILYEIIWLRLSMAQFGVTSALVSIVLSVFMAGLGLGSWGGGRLLRKFDNRTSFPALRLYALLELLIGFSALSVPHQLSWGRQLLQKLGSTSWEGYYLVSGIWIAISLVPWCCCMGATIPVAMLAIRQRFPLRAQRSFSYLYLANVLGATVGTIVPLALIEIYGFHASLKIGAALNFLLTVSAMALSTERRFSEKRGYATTASEATEVETARSTRLLGLLFITGLTSMGAEVVWIRQLTPYMGNAVYTFACILGLYLISTFLGSWSYRRHQNPGGRYETLVWTFLGLFVVVPLLTADPQLHIPKPIRPLGIVPFSLALGYVTPMLVDRWSRGDPDKAGGAYAINVLGCILGPLLAGFLLLPWISERWVLFTFALPYLIIGLNRKSWLERPTEGPAQYRKLSWAVAAATVAMLPISRDYQARFSDPEIFRDNTATVIAATDSVGKRLLVNGFGMSLLSPVTKMMAHLPLASLDHPPQSALVVCFGMGTTYRSLMSWKISVTAVELVPSVPRTFGYFHADGPQLLQSPLSRVVIDDGRRYLERTGEQFDVITLDPPPPIQSSGSSLLYSTEFYATAKRRLRPGGILQQWLPGGDDVVRASVTRSLIESFPYVRIFSEEHFVELNAHGLHFLASSQPIPKRTAAELAGRLPERAAQDLVEWNPGSSAENEFSTLLGNEISAQQLIARAPQTPALQDDRPVNEYYVLRKTWDRRRN